tara:strand:+ start:1781 stop:3028 length:1248 start_codon:yes stop_codon:yes gene_type:complete
MTATMISKFESARIKFRDSFKKGIIPVDGRQPIPDEIAVAMVQELIELELSKDALIGVYDAFLILSTHLKEAGFTNIVLLENNHRNLTPSQQKYYDKVKIVCEKSGIKYYVPPVNNYNRCDMKFDAILANPPYQKQTQHGSQKGSGNSALWWQITQNSFNLLKKDGILSFITPIAIVSGADLFTSKFLGNNREYDLKFVDFSAANSFKVGIDICRWVAFNKKTDGNTVSVSDGRNLSADKVVKIVADSTLSNILETLFNYDAPKFNFNTKNQYHNGAVANHCKKNNLPEEYATDFSDSQSEVYAYRQNVNGKIKYGRVKWKGLGIWRVFLPQIATVTEITVRNDTEAAASTFTMVVDSEDEGNNVKTILDNEVYTWIINQTRVSGRITPIVNEFPITPIEEVLTADQLSYIQSQL